MNINRHNYEEYFLLYADNELSLQHQDLLHQFLNENPDLKTELNLLQQSVLRLEKIELPGKEGLLKYTTEPAILESMLLMLDEELSPEQQHQFNAQLINNEDLNIEWQLLQQTKLSVLDVLLFDDKESLYRREQRPVIAFGWRTIAVAAMLIGAGVWGSIRFFYQDEPLLLPVENIAKVADPSVEKINTDRKQIDKRAAVTMLPAIEKNHQPANFIADSKSVKPIIKIQVSAKNKQPLKLDKELITVVEPLKKNGNNLPKSYLENLNNSNANTTAIANVAQENIKATAIVSIDFPKKNESNISAVSSINNSFTGKEPFENRVTSFDESDENESRPKLKGFFKRVKRVLERNANISKDDNNLKIANLSFAVH